MGEKRGRGNGILHANSVGNEIGEAELLRSDGQFGSGRAQAAPVSPSFSSNVTGNHQTQDVRP